MTQEQKHTALPYATNILEIVSNSGVVALAAIEGLALAGGVAPKNQPNQKEAFANAEFIVRACNSHYELINAAKELVTRWDEGKNPPRRLYDELRAALAKAEAI